MEKAIRILIVDPHAMVRAGLRLLIESRKSMVVVAEAATRGEAVVAASREQPDIILLDLQLRDGSGLDCLPRLLDVSPRSRVLIVTGSRDAEAPRRAAHLGAMGLVLKDHTAEVLIKAIEKVHAGEVWLDRATTARVLAERGRLNAAEANDPEAAKIASLTDREREVVSLVCAGLKTREIAERLFISEKTVSNHLASIYNKLEVSDRLELALYSYRQGLGCPPRTEQDGIISYR